jgi:hypothetical protein
MLAARREMVNRHRRSLGLPEYDQNPIQVGCLSCAFLGKFMATLLALKSWCAVCSRNEVLKQVRSYLFQELIADWERVRVELFNCICWWEPPSQETLSRGGSWADSDLDADDDADSSDVAQAHVCVCG